ncbi:UvrD-helicase domain-containing protein [Pelagibius sp. 7325]|uniref:UvrD-helicase domain-containing protein n=1 Tax=Pelagibius sp. 7325 TaxID=3131994 RepID=UPI0030EEFABF
MMASAPQSLADDAARCTALIALDRSLLVEAGAGSGKTAVMAGRIAMLLAEGAAPKHIAAVTFTELAASELLIRVRKFVEELAEGHVPPELRVALPDGVAASQRERLAAATVAIDEITCSTIHGFCQKLIKPYPVEADIDPGASVMDRDQADMAFFDVTDAWLRDALSGEGDGLLAEMVLREPVQTVDLVNTILRHFRSRRELAVEVPTNLAALVDAFQQAAGDFAASLAGSEVQEPETSSIANYFVEMAGEVSPSSEAETSGDLVLLLLANPHPDLCTQAGSFRKLQKKGKWEAAAKQAGLSKADGGRLNDAANEHYTACCTAWDEMKQAIATRVLADLTDLLAPVVDRFRDYKRSAALLDFDDLIFAARDLLRGNEPVRQALAARFAHVLVDEFQDTDPHQIEIFWRLCGEPPEGASGDNWQDFRIRPGALFLVGDPKQAIYRFRGADVAAYLLAREAFLAQDPDSVLPISTNFRSCAPILHYVNDRFEPLLSAENGQPGFTALDSFHPPRDGGLSVAALDIAVANEEGKATAEQQRDGEAEAVADMCARLIGSESILDRKTGHVRACRPGDIALLAPTGSELWRYEEALEQRGIPVATQAGKGFFRRQEVQDLIAITRTLADHRDTLALGALLRGPVVGLSEEELLDIVWALPRSEEAPEKLPRLDLSLDLEAIAHPLARDVIEKLQALRRRIHSTTPHELLAQAVDVLRLRPILLERHRDQAERALANVDLYLAMSRTYSVRGIRAFAEAMNAAWADESRAVEGRPDAQEESVALYTMHAAKGLEWPIVVPINTMTQVKGPENAVVDRASGHLYCPVLGVKPTGYEDVRDAEKAELDRERVRLWYVAATRAREMLVLPRLDVKPASSAWISLADLQLGELPALDLSHLPPEVALGAAGEENGQTREVFAAEAAEITSKQRQLTWAAPSRGESAVGPVLRSEVPEILMTDPDGATIEAPLAPAVQGGRDRGRILHKLLEEVLTGETPEERTALESRAATLIEEVGHTVAEDPAAGLAPTELADCVIRALALHEIAELRPRLAPELPVYASTVVEATEEVTAGVADAVAFDADGRPQVIVDWKSDVNPAPETVEHYRAQVSAYLDVTGAERGLIVLLTSGTVIDVAGAPAAVAAS